MNEKKIQVHTSDNHMLSDVLVDGWVRGVRVPAAGAALQLRASRLHVSLRHRLLRGDRTPRLGPTRRPGPSQG